MTPEQFCYWLQGKFEERDIKRLQGNELQSIKDHLALVFEKKTPSLSTNEKSLSDILNPKTNLYC